MSKLPVSCAVSLQFSRFCSWLSTSSLLQCWQPMLFLNFDDLFALTVTVILLLYRNYVQLCPNWLALSNFLLLFCIINIPPSISIIPTAFPCFALFGWIYSVSLEVLLCVNPIQDLQLCKTAVTWRTSRHFSDFDAPSLCFLVNNYTANVNCGC